MLFIKKRKRNIASEYLGEDGVWYTVNDMYTMVPINGDGDMLAKVSFHNRVKKGGWRRNPNLLNPKYAPEEKGAGGGNNESKLKNLSGDSRAHKLRAIKVGSFEKLGAK